MSGFAGLSYQVVWTQQLGIWLGHEIVSVLAVVAAFFGGLAVGAYVLGQLLERSRHPGRWYAGLELAIALWALVLAVSMPQAGALMTELIGAEPGPTRHWLVAFFGPLLMLLPATAAMGATLPAMQRALGGLRDEGYAVGGLYAANTLGAVIGVLAAAFILVPKIGLTGTAVLGSLLNVVCAVIAWRRFGRRVEPPWLTPTARSAARDLLPLVITGLLGIGYEVVMVRALSQIAENTVYTYALLLAVYLSGTAAGAALYQRHLTAHGDPEQLRARLLVALALSCLFGAVALGFGEPVKDAVLSAFGNRFGTALMAEAIVALMAFALPTLVMGALFSHLCVQARDSGWGFGNSIAANTIGAAVAAPVFGVALMPLFGAHAVLVGLSLAYLSLVPARKWVSARAWVPIAAAAAAAAWGPGLNIVDVPTGGRILSHRDGVMAAVSVVEDASGTRSLHINNKVREGSNATRVVDASQAWLPLLLHPSPRNALFLGLGTGVTSAAAAADPELDVEVVELLPEVIEASGLFVDSSAPALPRVLQADARRYVRASAARYDLIVADLFHPARSGSAALYTVEHFRAIRARLAPGGLFCQWLPLHQMDMEALRSVVRAFLDVYPGGVALLASNSLDTPVIGLVARTGPTEFEREALDKRLERMRHTPALAGLQLDDGFAVPGSFVADAASLHRFAGTAQPNRDDLPVVAYRAPRLAYAPDTLPRQRLLELLRSWSAEPQALFGPPDDAGQARWLERVAAYWSARKRYIEVGMEVTPQPDLRRMLAQVRKPLLEVLQVSPDFRPAYDPLLSMALALQRDDPNAARALLQVLRELQPGRSEAARALVRFRPDSSYPSDTHD